jgi:L-asparaginase II
MLALARFLGLPLSDYIDPGHPVQERILNALSEMCAIEPERIALGIDGCSVPTFAIPLRAAATGYARLADPSGLLPARAAACRRIFGAMASHPFLVAGPGRFDTLLIEAGRGRVVAKGGAEGYHGIALAPGAAGPGSPALGIALKVSDGDQGRPSDSPPGQRAGARAVLAVLEALGALEEERRQLDGFKERRLTNWRGLEVGEIRACLRLERRG